MGLSFQVASLVETRAYRCRYLETLCIRSTTVCWSQCLLWCIDSESRPYYSNRQRMSISYPWNDPTPPRRRRFAHSSSVLMFVVSLTRRVLRYLRIIQCYHHLLLLLHSYSYSCLALIRKISPRFVRVELIAFASRRDDDDGDDDDDDDMIGKLKTKSLLLLLTRTSSSFRAPSILLRVSRTRLDHTSCPSLPLSLLKQAMSN